jgi:hypothetical protein
MSERSVIQLLDRRTRTWVNATLIDGVTAAEVEAAERDWQPYLQGQLARMQSEGIPRDRLPQHSHWDWHAKQQFAERYLAYRLFGIEYDSQMQGLMLAITAGATCRLDSQKGKPLVYVDYLASAPWNLPNITPEPRFSLVGSVLLAAAVQLSIDEEFSGRIGLHSLPQADAWYANACGMSDLGRDAAKQDLRYFEMTPEQAAEFLR